MINCMRDNKKTVVSASGAAKQVAAECCEVIRAIYFEIPVEMRPLFKSCVLLAVSECEEFLKQAKELFGSENHPEGQQHDES